MRKFLSHYLAATAAAAVFTAGAVHAIGSLAEITVIDRNTGQTLPVYYHQGRHYVAGRPGARYGVRVFNKSGERVMAVMTIDGVNVVSGETASWDQNGYVFSPWQRFDVSGWRKSQAQVAAFEFTALENSYAARTGRPNNVGVIGVALFRELRVAPPPAVSQPPMRPEPYPNRAEGAAQGALDRLSKKAENTAGEPAPAASPAEASSGAAVDRERGDSSDRAVQRPSTRVLPESKLGTGHGQRENSWVEYTQFQRARATPDEVITIHYDSRDNLVAMGVLPPPRVLPGVPAPNPFPGQPAVGFVPDPPRHW